jgi:hypothetical protein
MLPPAEQVLESTVLALVVLPNTLQPGDTAGTPGAH